MLEITLLEFLKKIFSRLRVDSSRLPDKKKSRCLVKNPPKIPHDLLFFEICKGMFSIFSREKNPGEAWRVLVFQNSKRYFYQFPKNKSNEVRFQFASFFFNKCF